MAETDGKNWRELCAAATEEPDSEKLVSLVNQILQVFDERDRTSHSSPVAQSSFVTGRRRNSCA
jgi:hypothetical protein